MGIWSSLDGTIRVRITSASVGKTLSDINNSDIELMDTSVVNDLVVEAVVKRRCYKTLNKIIERKGDKLEILDRSGVYWDFVSLKKRPILLVGILIYVLLALYLPSRIFFVRVTGNESVPAEVIISQAETFGIRFGASRKDVRSEQVKNALLSAVPQLQWVGVNTYGCVAQITVRERTETPGKISNNGVCSIVASRDGVIQSLTATRGNVLCKVGQAVKAGQVLISGYTDCGISIKATAAEAEVYAKTKHNLTVKSPLNRAVRQQQAVKRTRYSIIIGKKLIKLYKDSGISDTGCVKIYSEQYLTLPGGFQLPIALASEVQIVYTTQTKILNEDVVFDRVETQSEEYLKNTMVAGAILSAQTSKQVAGEVLWMYGEYACVEMIGQIYNEEIIIGNE